MSKPSEPGAEARALREQVIGLGERSLRKSYYPQLLKQIEELRRHEEQLEELVAARTGELAAANQDLQSFAAAVSHDLRAPLRAIGGFSQILGREYGPRLDEEGRELLERLEGQVRQMEQLIGALLELAGATRAELRREPVNLSELAAQVVAELRRGQPERLVEVAVVPNVVAEGDPVLLRAVLQNLLANAWKFTARTATARLEFGETEQRGKRVYYVRDNGAGFDAAAAGKLFVPFQRLHDSKDFAGTGIGLATVRQIIRRHGGEVWAEGAVEQGATFSFTLG